MMIINTCEKIKCKKIIIGSSNFRKKEDLDIKKALKGTRKAYFFEQKDWIEVPVYDRYKLSNGMELEGPAIVEERESTVLLRPANFARVDSKLNIRIRLEKAQEIK